VALNGCHREATFPAGVDPWGNPDARYILVSSDSDEVCSTDETAHAETWLLSKGYDVAYVGGSAAEARIGRVNRLRWEEKPAALRFRCVLLFWRAVPGM